MAKVGKPDGEGTIAGTRGNGEDAPISAIPRNRNFGAGFHEADFRDPTMGGLLAACLR
jgi:hypothetical protein